MQIIHSQCEFPGTHPSPQESLDGFTNEQRNRFFELNHLNRRGIHGPITYSIRVYLLALDETIPRQPILQILLLRHKVQ